MAQTSQAFAVQAALLALGFDPHGVDGYWGRNSRAALQAWQRAAGLPTTDQPTAQSLSLLLKSERARPAPMLFTEASEARLREAHPLLQNVMRAARQKVDFEIMQSLRGRSAQEAAYRAGNSNAHYGQSAHNYAPAIALDIRPEVLDWTNRDAFIALSRVILPLAKTMAVPIRYGGDWNMNGIYTDEKLSDLPHYELHPWQEFAKQAALYRGA